METCESAAPVMMALGGGLHGFDMTQKKLKALKLVQELREALKDL